MTREAMKQALEALDDLMGWQTLAPAQTQRDAHRDITTLRQVIADEPLKRLAETELKLGIDYTLTQTNVGIGERGMQAYEAAKERGWAGVSDERLMKMPDEPVAWMRKDLGHVDFHKHAGYLPLYTRPQPAAWVGLTDEDKQIAFDDTQEASGGFWEFADAIEAKLKEKNQ